MLLTILFIFILIIFAGWIYGFYIRNDLFVPNADISRFKKVLIIFPHADDEVFTVSGLIGALNKQGSQTTLVILTKGERGNHDAHLDLNLKDIRSNEAKQVADLLKISELVQEDFGDNDLKNKKPELESYISKLIEEKNPDLLLTYDLSGMYGHDDHIVTAAIITDTVSKRAAKTELWYVTFPKRTIDLIKMPEHMATDANFKLRRVYPNLKLFTLPYIINKIKAIYLYRSQLDSFKGGMPVTQVPLWAYHSMSFYEYFHKLETKTKV